VTRIIAGSAGGRRLVVPPGEVRPTSDRVREALFSALDAEAGLNGAAVLDLCAGSGALGIEALSRGATHALFVESDRRVAAVLRRNLAELGLTDRAQVRVAPAASVLARPAPRGYDLVLVDPPYAVSNAEITGWLRAGWAHGWVTNATTVVVERPARAGAFGWPDPLQPRQERRYGDTVLHWGQSGGDELGRS
jgi:16S rRNA (guanine966-N2)-methyltransferase